MTKSDWSLVAVAVGVAILTASVPWLFFAGAAQTVTGCTGKIVGPRSQVNLQDIFIALLAAGRGWAALSCPFRMLATPDLMRP